MKKPRNAIKHKGSPRNGINVTTNTMYISKNHSQKIMEANDTDTKTNTQNKNTEPKNVLVTILTSSNIWYLQRAVRSVKSQKYLESKQPFTNVGLAIIVNTMNDSYLEQVIEAFPDEVVIETISNGLPGKGHNACLQYFKSKPVYTHLCMVDGDDFLYPYALHRLNTYLCKYPGTDIIHTTVNDKVKLGKSTMKTITPNVRSIHLGDNFHVFTILDNNDNIWKKKVPKSPWTVHSAKDLLTPSRCVLFSRKVLDTPFKYAENLAAFDDMTAFCHLYELTKNGTLNTLAITDSQIYVYNCLNVRSASNQLQFKSRELMDETKNLQKHLESFTVAEDWELLTVLPHGYIEPLTKFNKSAYLTQYAVTFEIQRNQQNFSKVLRKFKATKKPREILEVITRTLQLGMDDSHTLTKCTSILTAALGFVENSAPYQPLLSQLTSKVSQLFPSITNLENQIKCLYKTQNCHWIRYFAYVTRCVIETQHEPDKVRQLAQVQKVLEDINTFEKNIPNDLSKLINPDKKILVFHTGFSTNKNMLSYDQKKLEDSAHSTQYRILAYLRLMEKLTEYFNVFVVTSTRTKFSQENDVKYINSKDLTGMRYHFPIDIMICCNSVDYPMYCDLHNIGKVIYLQINDQPQTTAELPFDGLHVWENSVDTFFEYVVCPSKLHISKIKKYSPVTRELVKANDPKVIRIQPILPPMLREYASQQKLQNPKDIVFVCYCNEPRAGYVQIIFIMLERLRAKFPQIKLKIFYCGYAPMTVMMDNPPWVECYETYTEEELIEGFRYSQFWLCPFPMQNFLEAAWLAMATGTIPIVSGQDSMIQMFANCCITIPNSCENENQIIQYIGNELQQMLEIPPVMLRYQKLLKKRALKNNPNTVVEKWLTILQN